MSNQNAESCITLNGLLGVVFVTLKLCGVIQWSWWFVTLPFWGGFAIVAAVMLFLLTGIAFVYASSAFTNLVHRRKR